MKRWGQVLGQVAGLVLLAAIAGGVTLRWHPRRPILRQVPAAEVSTRPFITVQEAVEAPEVVWIDARDAASHARGHIQGAILLNPENWDAAVGEHFGLLQNHTKKLVIYGDTASAAWVSEKLQESYGRPNVPILQGGWEAWRKRKPTP